jgi:hypothetical protein
MKAGEVVAVCKEIKKDPAILLKTEDEAKKRFFLEKQKAASAGTLTA